jgi:hypothetical protein
MTAGYVKIQGTMFFAVESMVKKLQVRLDT